MPMRREFLILLAASAAVFTAVIVTFVVLPREQRGAVQSTGQALVGGPFTMVDQTGKMVTQDDYAGKFKLIYFGFTFCPDVCPTRLMTLTRALNLLGDDIEKVQPIFVTVDPERDTPKALAAYLGHFHPKFVGLTGTPEQVADMAGAFRVAYYKVQDPDASTYLMDHTDIIYLMGPDNKYRAHFTASSTAKEIAAGIREQL